MVHYTDGYPSPLGGGGTWEGTREGDKALAPRQCGGPLAFGASTGQEKDKLLQLPRPKSRVH